MSGHTPGPWTAFQSTASFFDVVKGNGEYDPSVASVWASEGRPAGANARLIAAAPDLLEALRILTMMAETSGGTSGPDAELMAACDQANRAIAKATGQ